MSKMDVSKMRFITKHFINGQFVNSIRGQTYKLINPATEEELAEVQKGSSEDIDLAVQSANHAFHKGPWGRMDPYDRSRCLYRLADLMEKHADELATIQAITNGKPIHIAKFVEVDLSRKIYYSMAGYVDKIMGSTIPMDGPFRLSTRKEPVGIAAQIIPWNVPLIMQAYKLAPALAAGCTVVMKTAENTPLSALRVAELINQAGFPPGVVNIVNGFGDIGAYLARHKKVDKVAFTGSLATGLDIIKNCHQHNLKRVTLQLGGKSPNIITKHANIQKAVDIAAQGVFFNAGQVCIAGTRVYVHSSLYDRYVDLAIKKARSTKLGHPLDPSSQYGPIINKKQFDKVMNYIKIGIEEKDNLVTGGKRHGNKGYFVEPTLFADVQDHMRIAREEIFGPVQCIFKYDDVDQVIARANDSEFGLGAGIQSQNSQEAEYIASRLKAGTIFKNCYNVFSPSAPFGGYKNSGIGREMALQGINAYLQKKTLIQRT